MTAKRLASLFFFTIVIAIPAHAQYATSTFTVVVSNNFGQPVRSVQIEWEEAGRLRSLATDSDGKFTSYFVSPGFHTFRFRHESTPAVGSFTGLAPAGSSLDLSVVLYQGQGNVVESGIWKVHVDLPGPPDAWQPERFLTMEQINLLPSTEHLWSFLNQTEPSVVVDRFDVSGLHSTEQLRLGVRGSSRLQNQGFVNGMSVTDPAGEGMLLFPDMSAMEAIVYSVGESPTRHIGPGARIDMIPKTGDRELHGEARLFFQSGALQNSNITPRYREFDITQSDERWKHFFNGGFQLSGPIGSRPWTYFAAVSGRELRKWVRSQPLTLSSTLEQQTFNIDGTISPKDRIGLYVSLQHRNEPQFGASTQVTRESSVDQRQTNRGFQGSWKREISSRTVLDVKLGVTHRHVAEQFQAGAQGQSVQELFPGYIVDGISPVLPMGEGYLRLTNTVRGPAPLVTNSGATTSEASVAYSMIRNSFWNSTHRISFGSSYTRSTLSENQTAIDGVNLLFFETAPNSVRLLNTPAHTRDRVSQAELYAVDNFSFSRLSFLAEGSADLSTTSNVLSSGHSVNNLRWRNLGGRVGAAFQLVRRLVFRASLAEIYDQPNLAAAAAFNPEGLGVQLYSWNDANGDRLFQSGENTQLLKVTGGPFTRMDPNLKNPRTSELTLGFAQSGLHGLRIELFGFHRTVDQLMSLVNEGVPFSSYTPIQVIDPGWDAVLGSEDDRTITVFNQKPETLGHDSYVLTNPPGFKSHSEGFEFSVGADTPKLQARATVTRYRAVAETGPGLNATGNDTSNLLGVFDNPNNAILAKGSTFFDRGTIVRMWVTTRFPLGFRLSAIGNYMDGLPYSRILPVTLNQGPTGILASQRGPGESGSHGGLRTTHYQTIDVRLSRNFKLGHGKLAASLDVFNLSNLALNLLQSEITSRTAFWRVPLQYETPRSLQPGLRYTW